MAWRRWALLVQGGAGELFAKMGKPTLQCAQLHERRVIK
jgi:hypothetical protein